MRKKTTMALAVLMLVAVVAQGALAAGTDIAGDWAGTISFSIFEGSAPVTVTFSDKGGYHIDVMGITSTGGYAVTGGQIKLTPTTPAGVGPATLSVELDGDTLHIFGSTAGIDGDLVVTRVDAAK